MQIDAINVYKLALPFNLTFSHSQKEAKSVDNIVVELIANERTLFGYGEGGPRPYVTGETQETAVRSVRSLSLHRDFPWDLSDIDQIWAFVESASTGKNQNAALCALEIGLLDLLARRKNRTVLSYLPMDHFTEEIRYGGTLPIAEQDTLIGICQMIRSYDIHEIRLKMGTDFEHNKRALRSVREVLGPECDLRVDVNGGWDLPNTLEHLPMLESHGVGILEQPLSVQDKDWKHLTSVVKDHGLKLMADESVCSAQEMEKAIEDGYFDVINVRLSKCGGFGNSLQVIQLTRQAGLSYQVGCQLGESGILSAAGRALCSVSSDALYFDGSYDTFLLSENITTQHVTFSRGGEAAPLEDPGLGVTINPENLRRFGDRSLTITKN